MTYEEWVEEGTRLFGSDKRKWKFVCPACGHIQSVQDYIDAGASDGSIAFSCIGRSMGTARRAFGDTGRSGPCDYAGGGLIGLNPINVDGQNYFDFYRGDENG